MAEKVYVPLGASETILESGRPLVPGEEAQLTKEELDSEFNKRLIEEGHVRTVTTRQKEGDG